AILTDDRRFWLKDLRQVGKSLSRSSYGPWSELRPIDDPDVVRLHARQRVQYLARKITVEVNYLPRGASVAQVVELLESIERRVAGVRADVAALNDEDG
ncbi:MAG TPA: hypothetical protein VGW74_06350, partial [Propionibacteriaceae bacterium]|nr:hypothetical protein [Propionibacteriaceae bacterium]